MKEIREIFETVRTYCGMMFGENRAAKQLGSGAAKRNCHLEKMQPLSVVIPSDSEGSQPIKIERLVAYPSKSSLTREDLCYGKVAHDNNFDSPETVYSLLTTHHSLKRAAFTLAEGATHVALSDKSRKSAFTLDESFTHVAHCDKFRRAAFTLAEVLITLGIIGVVAALTLPTLIQNHQKQVYVTQLKKAYSTLNNAFNKMAVDEGVVDWNQTYCGSNASNEQRVEAFNEECYARILKQFNIVQSRKANEDKAWGNSGYDVCGSYSCVHGGEYMFATADGTTYIFPCYTVFQYNNEMVVDVNGLEKGPNKEGRDVFSFYIDFNNNKILPGGTYDYSGNASESYKNCSATNLSADCTAKVLIEGKMNY